VIRLLSIILTIVLFPPALLAVISNNAVPGDSTYPIKRSLENIIVLAASINPNTKAAFSQTRSNTRYKEFSSLIAQGKQTSGTLNELVDQTDLAVSQLSQVTDPVEKAKLIAQLSVSIEKYDAGLQEVSSAQPEPDATNLADSSLPSNDEVQETVENVQPTPTPVITAISRRETTTPQPSVAPTSNPIASPIPSPVGAVRATPSPTAQSTTRPTATPRPTVVPSSQVTPRPTSHPTPSPTPTSTPNTSDEAERRKQREIEEARRRLKESKKRLGQEQERAASHSRSDSDEKIEKPTEKPKEKENEKNDKDDNSSKRN